MVGKTISHYRIIEKLGDGGMGEVYKAEDTRLKRVVALKFLLPQLTRDKDAKLRFMSEAQTASSLEHPNICAIHAIEEKEDGQLFISMSYCERDTLRKRLSASPLNMTDSLDIAIQIAQGLAKAHENGIVHRDLKPENIGIAKDGIIKILDFGLAKLTGSPIGSHTSHITGTLAYMSPEQSTAQPVDQRSDIWSLGVMLYEILAGQLPFDQGYGAAILYSIAHEPHTNPTQINPDIPPAIEAIINKAMEKSPDNRYASIEEMLADLQQARFDLDVPPGEFSSKYTTSLTKSAVSHGKVQRKPARWPSKKLLLMLPGMVLILAALSFYRPIGTWLGFNFVPAQKHILVLPFTNVSGDQADQAFCDGLVEILASKLTQLEQFQGSLFVIPASEVRQSGISSAVQARKHFGANLVISGSVQRSTDRIQLTMNLIDAKELRQLNSAVISDNLSGGAYFQDKVVHELTAMLEVKLQPQSRRILAAGNTTVSKAYDYYLQGRGYLVNYNDHENIENAIDLLQKALKEDSKYALAYAGLGEAYWRKYELTKDPGWVEPAIENCNRALGFNNLLAPVHITLGIIYRGTGKYEEAVTEFKRALEIDPVNSDAFRELAGTYADQGTLDEAENTYLKAIELKPSYWANYYGLGLFYYRNGEYEKAEKQYLKVTALSPFNYKAYATLGGIYLLMERNDDARQMFERSIEIFPNYGAYSNLGTLYFMGKNYEQAARMYEKALEINDRFYPLWGNLATCYKLSPNENENARAEQTFKHAIQLAQEKLEVNPNDPEVLSMTAVYYAELTNAEKARYHIEKAIAQAPGDVELEFRAAEIYAMIGDKEKSFDYLKELLEGGYSLQRIQQSPALQELQRDNRFRELIKKYQ